MQTGEDYEKSIEDENDFSDFYNTSNEETIKNIENKDNTKLKKIIFIALLALVIVTVIVLLIIFFIKRKAVDFNLSLENVESGVWSKENVTINVDIPNESRLKSLKYTINCDKDCSYVDVTDKKILISNNGESVVTVVATNKSDVENRKNIVVKIDNTNPQLTLSPNEKNIKATGTVTVCAVCEDNESGCKESKVCVDYKETSKNQTLTVEDNAGNKVTSDIFNVTIGNSDSTSTTTAPSCSLSVTKNGVVTATYKNADSYHGFSSSYSGSNADKNQITLNNSGETKTVKYYVKNSDGKTASCSIEVIANKCTCMYRADENGGYKCYKTLIKTINDPNSAECKKAQNKTNTSCSFYSDEGLTCEYSKKVTK